jgi:hypothetical protein
MLKTLEDRQLLGTVNSIIEYLREIELRSDQPCFMELMDLEITPAMAKLLKFVGLDYYQTDDSSLIAWKDNLEKAISSYTAEREYKQLRKDRNIYGD